MKRVSLLLPLLVLPAAAALAGTEPAPSAADATPQTEPALFCELNADNAVGLVTDINVVSTEQATETTVYSTSGQLLWQGKGQPQLPRGIYVVKQGGQARKVQF